MLIVIFRRRVFFLGTDPPLPLGLPQQQRVSNAQRAPGATMKKPFAWVSRGAIGTNLACPGAPDCLSRGINIEALCAAPPEALKHSPSQMPLSCPVAPTSHPAEPLKHTVVAPG